MKYKTFCILAIICCLNLFSSAKQNHKRCDNNFCCNMNKVKAAKKAQIKNQEQLEFNFSPLNLLLFDL